MQGVVGGVVLYDRSIHIGAPPEEREKLLEIPRALAVGVVVAMVPSPAAAPVAVQLSQQASSFMYQASNQVN